MQTGRTGERAAALCAAACLPAGFGIAVATGVRPLGGVALVVLAAVAGRASSAERKHEIAWYTVVFVCFVASHVLGHFIGAWPAVAVVTVVATAAYTRLLRPAAILAR